jgi:hypothetical protein
MNQIFTLSNLLNLQWKVLERHLQVPLKPPQPALMTGWTAPDGITAIRGVCDGFQLFGADRRPLPIPTRQGQSVGDYAHTTTFLPL